MTAAILLIEDEVPTMRLISWILTDRGYEVTATLDAADAIERTGAVRPDIIIFNASVPEEQRRREAEEFRARMPTAKILDVHDHHAPDCVTDFPADGFLHKPFDAEDLLAAVDRLSGQAEPTPL